jgi:signal transduction histidine kinase/CheY-like chemotaxis protein
MLRQREPDNKKAIKAKLKLRLDLLAICIFFMACVDMPLFFLLGDSLRLAAVIPLVAGSCMVTIVLYWVLNAFFLRPLFKLHNALGRTLVTGLRVPENKSGDGDLYSELHGMFNYLAENLHDKEAGLSAFNEDAQGKTAFLLRLTDEFRDPLQKIVSLAGQMGAAPDLEEARQTLTPLNVLSGNQNTAPNPDAENLRSAALALLDILEQIRDYALVESGRVNIENYPFRLDDVLLELAEKYRGRCHKRNRDFIFAIAPGIPQELSGDRGRLAQLLGILIENALSGTSTGEICLSCILEEQNAQQATLRFVVRDSGKKLTREELSRMFSFFGPDTSMDSRARGGNALTGLGLGMPAARRLAQLMGGELNVRSLYPLGTGVTFTIRPGLRDSGQSPALFSPEAEEAKILAGKYLLVVDNIESNRLAVSELLKHRASKTDTAASVQEASELLEKAANSRIPGLFNKRLQNFHLVILSMSLPENGAFTLARLLAEKKYAYPALVLMGAGEAPSAEELQKYDIKTFIARPVTGTSLLRGVLDAIKNAAERPAG